MPKELRPKNGKNMMKLGALYGNRELPRCACQIHGSLFGTRESFRRARAKICVDSPKSAAVQQRVQRPNASLLRTGLGGLQTCQILFFKALMPLSLRSIHLQARSRPKAGSSPISTTHGTPMKTTSMRCRPLTRTTLTLSRAALILNIASRPPMRCLLRQAHRWH